MLLLIEVFLNIRQTYAFSLVVESDMGALKELIWIMYFPILKMTFVENFVLHNQVRCKKILSFINHKCFMI
jgi:hypothetical protein